MTDTPRRLDTSPWAGTPPPPAPADTPPTDWSAYWDSLEDRQAIFAAEADDFAQRMEAVVPLTSTTRLLDFGCGFGHIGRRLAPRVGAYYPWDASHAMRLRTQATLGGAPNVHYLDFSHDEGCKGTPRFDVILVNSVIQYLDDTQLNTHLSRWRGLLAEEGWLVLSDLVPEQASPLREWWDLLSFCALRGFLFPAVVDGSREFRRYQPLRKRLPLQARDPAKLEALSAAHGLSCTRLPTNLTYRRSRWTAVLQRRMQATQSPHVS